jgi:ribonuclease P protein component
VVFILIGGFMKEKYRIKDKREFDLIFHNSKQIKNSVFVFYYKEKKLSYPRFGFAVGKKIGNAVIRNRNKRILRELVRTNYDKFNQNYDYIILIRKRCDTINYNQLKEIFLELI